MADTGHVVELSEHGAAEFVAKGLARYAKLSETVGHRSPCGPIVTR